MTPYESPHSEDSFGVTIVVLGSLSRNSVISQQARVAILAWVGVTEIGVFEAFRKTSLFQFAFKVVVPIPASRLVHLSPHWHVLPGREMCFHLILGVTRPAFYCLTKHNAYQITMSIESPQYCYRRCQIYYTIVIPSFSSTQWHSPIYITAGSPTFCPQMTQSLHLLWRPQQGWCSSSLKKPITCTILAMVGDLYKYSTRTVR